MASQLTATAIASGVRSGSLKAVDVLEQHLAAIDERETEIHAFNLVLADQARSRAAEVDEAVAAGHDPGPLAGVPIALKDNMCTRGVPTTCSSKILEGWKPPYDGTVVSMLRNAGAIAVGLAGDLFPKDLVQNRDWRAIGKIAQTLSQNLTTC